MDKDLIEEYEYSLKNKDYYIANTYLNKKSESAILDMVKYAVEYILHISPSTAERTLTYKHLENLKLMDYLDRHVDFLPGLNEYKESKIVDSNGKRIKIKKRNLLKEPMTIKYLLHKCYPHKILFDKTAYLRDIYIKMLNQKLIMPKGFFGNASNGKLCSYICLNYAINTYLVDIEVHSYEELYAFFANEKKAKAFFNKYKLTKAAKLYPDAISYLHETLPIEDRIDIVYRYYKDYLPKYNIAKKAIRAN